MMKLTKTILVLAAVAVFTFALWAPLRDTAMRVQDAYFPCQSPITYSIGSFDKRFGISREEFLAAIAKAEQIWETAIGKELFSLAPSGGEVAVNLIFDSRQEATIKLRQSGIVIKDDKATYELFRKKYEALKARYDKNIALLTSRVAAFKTRQDAYNQEVAYWNQRRGAPADAYTRLNREKAALDIEADAIHQSQSDNNNVDDINALVDALQRIAVSLNLKVEEFNRIGRQNGGEFEEGTYQSGPEGEQIDIYQFDDTGKLIRVLAHEFGHALGLDHLENTKAIMYRLNSGVNEKLTQDDIVALQVHCKI